MRKSLLFIPGNNPGMIQTSDLFESDAIIFDLEDAVSLNEKDAARHLVSCFLASKEHTDQEIIIRINPVDTDDFIKDVNAIIDTKLDTILLPKATIKSVQALNDLLDIKLKNKQKDIHIIALIESAMGLLDVHEIAFMKRVNGLLLGGEDLSSDLGVKRTKEGLEIQYARSVVATTAHAAKISAIDTPFTDVNDELGLKEDIKTARQLAMTSKSAIHPRQVPIINQLFLPTKDEIKYALRVIEASKKSNKGAFSIDGKMIDKPVIDRAQRILDVANKYGLVSDSNG